MLTSPNSRPPSRAEKFLRVSWLLPAIVALVVGWILFSRWSEARRIEERRAGERRAKESEENRRAYEYLGGGRFEILHFYAQPAVLRRGETATLCYGASSAVKVKLEPPVESVWPSPNRCFEIKPARDTTYTLTIENAKGETKTATMEVKFAR